MQIELQGQYAGTLLIDDDDWSREFVCNFRNGSTFAAVPSAHTWHGNGKATSDVMYAAFNVHTASGWRCVLLHRLLTEAPSAMVVDHIDGNGLNNRRSNLRLCTVGENNTNNRLAASATSSFRGVCYDRTHSKWKVTIGSKGKRHSLGYFHSEIAAARAYDVAAKQLHGAFATPNLS